MSWNDYFHEHYHCYCLEVNGTGITNDRSTLVQVMVCQATSLNQCWLRSMVSYSGTWQWDNTLWPRLNGRHFADDTFKQIFLNGNVRISIVISLKFVPKGPINNIPALVQIMAWRRPSYKPLSEPMMVSLATHICITLPQWVNIAQGINPCYAEFVLRNAKICLHFLIWDGTGSWSHSSQKTKACLSCILKTEADKYDIWCEASMVRSSG